MTVAINAEARAAKMTNSQLEPLHSSSSAGCRQSRPEESDVHCACRHVFASLLLNKTPEHWKLSQLFFESLSLGPGRLPMSRGIADRAAFVRFRRAMS